MRGHGWCRLMWTKLRPRGATLHGGRESCRTKRDRTLEQGPESTDTEPSCRGQTRREESLRDRCYLCPESARTGRKENQHLIQDQNPEGSVEALRQRHRTCFTETRMLGPGLSHPDVDGWSSASALKLKLQIKSRLESSCLQL